MNRLTATNRLNDGGRHIVENPQAADLSVDLTNSIIPRRWVGSVTYTRASVATVTDNEWVIRTVNSGEARFLGARRVQNLYSYSQDISNAVWTAVSCTKQSNVTTAPDGTLTADRVQTNASTALMEMFQNLDVVAGKTYTYSAHVKYHNWRYIQLVGNGFTFGLGYINIDLQTGTITSTTAWAGNFSGTITSVWNGWYKISVTATCIATLAAQHLSIAFINTGTDPRVSAWVWDGTSGYYIWGIQLENVTGQSVQTAGEYVSRNVLTSSPFHWANVDWVKYFNTTLSGATIPASTLKGYLTESSKKNLFLQSEDFSTSWVVSGGWSVSVNQWLAPDGTMWMDKFIPWVTTTAQYINQSVTTTANTYTQSVYVKSSWYNYIQMWCSGSISGWYVNFDLSTGTVTASSIWTGVIEALPNGVYRCSAITWNVLAATGSFVVWLIATPTATRASSFGWNGTDWIFLWWAQFELWDFVSSYIPTTTTDVTRNADALSYSGSNAIASQWAAYCEASIILPGQTTSSLPRRIISRWGNGRILYTAVNIDSINSYDGTNGLQSNTWTTMNWNVIKMASSWSGSTKDIYYGTTAPRSGAFNGTMGAGNIDIGIDWFGTIRNLKIWKTPPTVAELTSITTL